MQKIPSLALAVLLAGCAHQRLSGADLDRVSHPAFISRIEEGAGPKSRVFTEDNAYQGRLNRLQPVEADRRLRLKLANGIGRFEVSDRLRADTLAHLPKERPWTRAVDPAAVAGVLESFLIEEVPANPPDYELLSPLGADAVVEFVIQDYGMRSANGHAGAYVSGLGRLFFLRGPEVWRSTFVMDQIQLHEPALDPFEVAKRPELFRDAMSKLLDQAAAQFARELSPPERSLEGTRHEARPAEDLPKKITDTERTPAEKPKPDDSLEPEKPPGEPR